jgi:hypothetical protein
MWYGCSVLMLELWELVVLVLRSGWSYPAFSGCWNCGGCCVGVGVGVGVGFALGRNWS